MKRTKQLGPRELPVIGSAVQFGKDPLKFLDKLHEEYGQIAEYSLLGSPFVAVYDPEMVEHVLTKNSSNYIKNIYLRERWKSFFGKSVLNTDGDEWKLNRKALQPLMSRDKVGKYFHIILEQSEKYVEEVADKQTINIKKDMMELLLFGLIKILFQSDLEEQKIKKFGVLFNDCMDYFEYILRPEGILFHRFPTAIKKRYHDAIAELEHMIEEILANDGGSSVTNQGMLSVLKQVRDDQGNPLTARQIRDNILTLFIAGHETSSLSICYSLFLLSQNPSEMKKVQEEVDRVLEGRLPNIMDLESLPKVKNVLYESMRLYPPVGIIGREAIGEDVIGDIKITKGTNVVVPIYTIHRSPHHYQDPLAFKPDRWDQVKTNSPRGDFLPFGAGPRLCMGANFAMMEIMTVLTILIQRFDFELKSSLDFKLMSSVSMRPDKDILLESRRRDVKVQKKAS